MELETFLSCPEQITVRQVVNCQRGYQPRVFLTTLTDRHLVSDKQIVKLYLLRWNVETDFRSLKCALEAGILTCRTADMRSAFTIPCCFGVPGR